jgi:RHS repeat-associated protein
VTGLTYQGAQWIGTQQMVATAITGAEQCVGRWERFDRQSRLDRVEEGYLNCAGSVGMNTQYSYDEAGHLVKVCQDTVNGSICGQIRLFSYDNRGFLQSEQHPEKGASGNGSVTHSCFDARGHARYRDDGASTRRLAYTYDGLERLTEVRVPAGSEDCNDAPDTVTLWKQFTYATANSASNAKKGKLVTAMSRNELGAPAFPANSVANVTHTYTYGDRGGRVSHRLTAVAGMGVPSESWQTSQSTTSLGHLSLLGYPTCVSGPGCTGGPPGISSQSSYGQGLLTSMNVVSSGSILSGVTYHASGMPNVIQHGNPVRLTETISQASHGMPRPEMITITTSSPDPPNSFTTGTYGYDGAGNIESMGNDDFRYDRFSRLVEAQLGAPLVPSQSQITTFDLFGNVTAMNTNGTGVNYPTSALTNRLSSATHDPAGNLTGWNGNTYSWDPLNRMSRWSNGSEGWSYVYDANDERLWSIKDIAGGGYSNWTFRGLRNEVLTRDERRPASAFAKISSSFSFCPSLPPLVGVFCDNFETGDTSGWSSSSQEALRRLTRYAYRDGKLVSSLEVGGDYVDFGLDHLGTIRVATNFFDEIGAQHTYFPFGQEATPTGQDAEVMKFTGHERDLQSTPFATADDFDYMHARYRSPLTSRFLSVDPVGGRPKTPQSWNRYAYARGNPLNRIDPDGRADRDMNKELAQIRAGEVAEGIDRTDCQKCKNLILGMATPVVVAAGGGAIAALPLAGGPAAAAKLANAAMFGAAVNGISSAATHPEKAGQALFLGSAVGFGEGLVAPEGVATLGKVMGSSLATSWALGDDITFQGIAFSAAGAIPRSALGFGRSLPGVGAVEKAVLETADRTLEVMFAATSATIDSLDKN